jgi:hypothetical protein
MTGQALVTIQYCHELHLRTSLFLAFVVLPSKSIHLPFDMANTIVYTSAGVAFILIVLLFLVAWIQNSVNENRLLATPSIPKENGVFTTFASARIAAPADEVFKVMLNYKDYSKWSCFSQYKWRETTEDGAPLVGSTGSFKVHLGFILFCASLQCIILNFKGDFYPGGSWTIDSSTFGSKKAGSQHSETMTDSQS